MNFQCWLDKDKPILRQITTTHSDARFYFIVKFYTPNPADLVEEYTRCQFFTFFKLILMKIFQKLKNKRSH